MVIKHAQLFGFDVSYSNEEAYKSTVKEIVKYKENNYKDFVINKDKKSPVILDVGSNIGLTVLYFKKTYPDARIFAFEANPTTGDLLKQNIQQNNLEDIKVVEAAVTKSGDDVTFFVENNKDTPHGLGDTFKNNPWLSDDTYHKIKVPAVRLSEYLNQPVDLVKMDIEGAETEVFDEIEEKINNIGVLILEFHAYRNNTSNNINSIIKILKKNKFKIEILHSRRRVPVSLLNLYTKSYGKIKDMYYLMVYAKNPNYKSTPKNGN